MRLPDHLAPSFELRACLREAVGELSAGLRTGGDPLIVPIPPSAPPGPDWPHHHAAPELFIQLSGTTAFVFPHGRCALAAGRMLLMPSMLGHRETQIDRPGRYAHLVLTAPLPGVVGYHLHTRRRDGERPRIVAAAAVRTPRAALVAQLMDELVRASHGGMAQAAEARLGGALLLLATIADLCAGGVSAGAEPDLRSERCERLLHLHLHETDLSVGQLASWLGIGADQLTRSFRRATGTTPMARLGQLRMQRAVSLLATTAVPVATIAATTGFADPAYFCRAFRRVHGLPPGRWRRRRGEQHNAG